MVKLVEGFAAQLVVPEGARDIQVFDDTLPGFGIRKFASGKAVFIVKYTVGRQQRKMSLGPVVRGVLADKRKLASQILSRARIGQDVAGQKRAAAGKARSKLSELVSTYLDDREPKLRPRYYAEIKRQLENDWKPLHSKSIETVGRQTIVGIVDDIAQGQGEVAADRARVALSGLFAWAIERGHCDANPTLNIARRAQNGARNRVLSETELVEVWRTCRDDDYGRIVRLLILTGQRRTEIGDLGWSEIDLQSKRQFELPAERTKNGRPHIVPLSDAVLAILTAIEQREDREFVFGLRAGGFSGWSKAKAELDERVAENRIEAGNQKPMQAWVLHDLRRSFVTHVNEHKFAPPHVVEAIVNHASGHLAGVAGTYNKALYLDERRDALEKWSSHVLTLGRVQRKTAA